MLVGYCQYGTSRGRVLIEDPRRAQLLHLTTSYRSSTTPSGNFLDERRRRLISRWRGATSGIPLPMKTGTTWISNSSISPASRNDAISSPPPIIQIFFPGVARRRRANFLTGSETNSTPGATRFGGFLENTRLATLVSNSPSFLPAFFQ